MTFTVYFIFYSFALTLSISVSPNWLYISHDMLCYAKFRAKCIVCVRACVCVRLCAFVHFTSNIVQRVSYMSIEHCICSIFFAIFSVCFICSFDC